MTDVYHVYMLIGLDVEIETNVIVEEGERRRPYIDAGHDAFDDNVIITTGERLPDPGFRSQDAILYNP